MHRQSTAEEYAKKASGYKNKGKVRRERNRGAIQAAQSTAGRSAALAQQIRPARDKGQKCSCGLQSLNLAPRDLSA